MTIAILCGQNAGAQTFTGTITGVVTDQAGALVADAQNYANQAYHSWYIKSDPHPTSFCKQPSFPALAGTQVRGKQWSNGLLGNWFGSIRHRCHRAWD
jgi:hypothetical protein